MCPSVHVFLNKKFSPFKDFQTWLYGEWKYPVQWNCSKLNHFCAYVVVHGLSLERKFKTSLVGSSSFPSQLLFFYRTKNLGLNFEQVIRISEIEKKTFIVRVRLGWVWVGGDIYHFRLSSNLSMLASMMTWFVLCKVISTLDFKNLNLKTTYLNGKFLNKINGRKMRLSVSESPWSLPGNYNRKK